MQHRFMTVMVVLYTNFTDYKYRSTKEKKGTKTIKLLDSYSMVANLI